MNYWAISIIVIILIIILYFAIGLIVYQIYRSKRRDGLPFFKYSSIHNYDGLNQNQFTFYNRKSIKLNGSVFYYHKYSDIENVIVFIHGNSHGYEQYLNVINAFCEKGFAVITYSMQGCGNSGGKSINCFTHGLLDYQDFCKLLSSKKELIANKHLYLMGHSWGGFIALNNCVSKIIQFKKVISLSAFDYEPSLIGQMSIIGYIWFPLFCLIHRIKFKEVWNCKSSNSVAQCDVPTLVVHGGEDHLIKKKCSFYKYKKRSANNDKVHFYLAEGCGHVCFLNPKSSKTLDTIQAKLTILNYFINIPIFKKKASLIAEKFDYSMCDDINNNVINAIFKFISED